MLKIRPAVASDAATLRSLILGLAEYEKLTHLVKITEEDLLRDGFGPAPRFRCLIAEWDGQPVGYALFFYNYSTFLGHAGIYLEDLFVWPELRGRGIGKALLLKVAKIAVDEGCTRYEWQVLDWNQPSIDFYESMGASLSKQWIPVRAEGEVLAEMARKSRD
ncbi:MAG: GNAT family N-acetyltransferase [Acidobacteriota bacterium]|nr:GNAT family N-acetyltransferase [Acidobacteriota bacterium]